MSEIQAGDTVKLLSSPRNYDYGYVIKVDAGPEHLLTLDTAPGGLAYYLPEDVEKVDMPPVEPGQVWVCDATGTKARVLEPSWMNKPGSRLIWETETLTRGRWVGTVILAAPAWRLADSGPDRAALLTPHTAMASRIDRPTGEQPS